MADKEDREAARALAAQANVVIRLPAQATLTEAGYECARADGGAPGVLRSYTSNPFGNRVEFEQA